MIAPAAMDRGSADGEPQRVERPERARSERQRMLDAMMRVAAAKGYEATTVVDVVDVAEVAEAAFFETFGDKEGCFLESYDAIVDALVAGVSDAVEATAGRSWPDRIAGGLRALLRLLAAEPEIARLAMVEATAIGENARARYQAALARFTSFLDEGRAYSARGEELPADTARLAVGGAASMIFEEVRAGRGRELEGILANLVFTILMPYLGPEAAAEEMRRAAG